MPNTEARKINKKISENEGNTVKETSSIRKYFKRVKGGYTCRNNRFLKLMETIPIKHRKPQDNSIPDVCKEKRQVYGRKHCEDCPYIDECPKKIEDRIPFLIRWMTDKYLDLRHCVHYPLRFSRSEGINAFHKTEEGNLLFLGTTKNAVDNELDLRNTVYDLIRINTLKEEGY